MRNEHALENQLPFLQKALGGGGFKIVPILFGALEKKDFAAMAATIAPYVDEQTLVVASSDLTHYGENFSYTPFRHDMHANLTTLDKGFIEPMRKLDFDGLLRLPRKDRHHRLRLRPHRRHDPPVRKAELSRCTWPTTPSRAT